MTVTEYRPSISDVLSAYGADVDGIRDEGWQPIRCPFHDDTHSSASFNESEGVYKCFACGIQGDALTVISKSQQCSVEQARQILSDLDVERKPVTKQESPARRNPRKGRAMIQEAAQRYADTIDGASGYLKTRGITRTAALAATLGFVADPLPGHDAYRGRLSIPYVTTSGVVDLKFRCIQQHECKDHGHSKYLCLPGSDTHMYHVTSTLTTRPYLAVTEGELDAVILNHMCDIPAVGIPGATNWQPHYSRVLEGFDRVYVLGDGDKAGRTFTAELAKKIEGAVPIVLPEGEDVNDVYLRGGAATLMNLIGV